MNRAATIKIKDEDS